MQKVEVFEEVLRTTSGDDLRQTLWMKSPKFILYKYTNNRNINVIFLVLKFGLIVVQIIRAQWHVCQ